MFLGRAPAFHDVELNMNLNEFRQSLTATKPPPGLTPALAVLWWDAKGIGSGPTDRLNRTKSPGVRGACLPASQGRRFGKTQLTGTVGQASLFAASHWMRNG
jgi:hypothetical protein